MSREITDKKRADLPVEAREWLQWLKTEREASRHTLDNYGRDLRRFRAFLNLRDCRSFKALGPEMVQAFVVAEFGQGRSLRSVAWELSTLRGFFKFLASKGFLREQARQAASAPPDRPWPLDSGLNGRRGGSPCRY